MSIAYDARMNGDRNVCRARGSSLALALVAWQCCFATGVASQARDALALEPSESVVERFEWLEEAGRRVVERDASGLVLVHRGRRIPVQLGSERVIVVGADTSLLEARGLELDEVLSERARVWAVRSRTEGEGPFEVAARLAPDVARGALATAAPDLAFEHVRHDIDVPPDDPRFGGQWFFETLDMQSAWAIEDGRPEVTIAVVDDGCDLMHPDLEAHMLAGYDAVDDDDDPSFLPGESGNEHGTACAGLAAAVTDNGVDVAGACPECSLRCVRLLGASGAAVPVSSDVRAFDFVLEHPDVAVVSNSWGFASGVPVPSALAAVIRTVLTEARGGLGALVVFAAGNDAATIASDELQAIEGVLTVGATNTFDEATSFSNRGECLALVSPTGTLTTDLQGAEGASDGDVTSSFGGTSSSCPIVAGIAGLVASLDGAKSASELRAILVDSARAAPYATPDADGHDLVYGYGIVDPVAALESVRATRDAGVALDAAVSDASVPSPSSAGCACSVGAPRAPRGLAVLVLALLVGLAVRRTSRVGVRTGSIGATLVPLLAGCALLVGCASPSARPTSLALRPDSDDGEELPPRYDATDVVESIASPGGRFRVHFSRTGQHAVEATDTDADGTPDAVETVAEAFDAVLAFDVALGFREPRSDLDVPDDNGGDGLFDVYLVDFGGSSDGAYRRERCVEGEGCAGYMLVENDFAGYGYPSFEAAARLLASHEFFHAVQAAYDDAEGLQGSVLGEGTAVWASERFDASSDDLERFAVGYTSRTDRSLGVDPVGAGGAYTYGAGVVFEFLTERFGDGLVRELWEALATASGADLDSWIEVLDGVLGVHGTTFDAAFRELASWLVFLGERDDEAHGPVEGAAFDEVAATAVALPYADPSLRFFPASIRYFEVPSGHVRVALTGDDAASIGVHLLAFDGNALVAEQRGDATAAIDVEASRTLVALVDARVDGASRVVSVCIHDGAAGCDHAGDAGDAGAVEGPEDAGVLDASPVDGGVVEAGVSTTGCVCRAGAGRRGGPVVPVVVVGAVVVLRRARRRRT